MYLFYTFNNLGVHMPKHLLLLLSFSLLVYSQEVDFMQLSLEELLNVEVTTASKVAQKSNIAPATITVINEEQIKIRGYRSLGELIKDLPSFNVLTYAYNNNPVSIRGIGDQDKFIILLNGIKISSPTNEMIGIMENYPLHIAKQVEIIYGPASALYGADAVTGVINIITKEPKNDVVDVSLEYGNYNSINGTAFYSKKINGNQTLNLGFQYYYEDGPDFPKFYKDNDDYGKANSFFANPTYNNQPLKNPVTRKFEVPVYAYNAFVNYKIHDFSFTYFGNYARQSSSYGMHPDQAVYNKNVYFGEYINMFDGRY